VGTTEKGYLTVELRVEAAGGHSSMPPVQTAIGILAAAVARLEARPLPARLEGTARAMFERLAPEMPFGPRLALANLWLFRPLVERQLAGSPVTNAFIRTTTAVTIIEGGVKDNVLPTRARAAVNFRIRPGESVAEVMRHVRQAVADERVTVAQRGPAVEPAPESDRSGPSFARLAGVIESALPGVVVAPYPVIGATDSRHFVPLTRNVYRFLPLRAGPEDLKRYHGSNERISLANYRECVAFYRRLLSAS
jgi:carboxypeptidase PM20D1